MIKNLLLEIKKIQNPNRATISKNFFKTGKGQYGEGDVFIGVSMPQLRKLQKKYFAQLTEKDILDLLNSPTHEVRMIAVLSVIQKYNEGEKDKYFNVYIKNTGFKKGINNWDLIDVSSEHVVGEYLFNKFNQEKRFKFIDSCIASPDLWINRMAVLTCFYEIKKGGNKTIFYVAKKYFSHKHDLIHKAVGWMLRESGKRCSKIDLINFLNKWHLKMPRTMLRYSIEKFSEKEKSKFV